MSDVLLIPGRYLAKPLEAALGKTSKGGEQVAVTFALLAPQSVEGRRITWYGYFTEKTVERTLESLEHCGWDGESIAKLNGVGTKDVELVIEHEKDDDGDTRARVRWVNAPGGAALKHKLSEAESLDLEARLKGQLLARKQARKNDEPKDSDTPF